MSPFRSSSQSQKHSNKQSNPLFTSETDQIFKSSAYDRDFEQKCIDHGIYMPQRDTRPENWQELQERLARPRLSLSPSQFSDETFDRFCEAAEEVKDENDVNMETLPTILGKKRRDCPSAGNVPFSNIDDMAPDIFKKPKPDLYWGARPAQINRQVRQDLNHQILPSTKADYPAAPNFFFETKGPSGSAAVQRRQACYNGALGVRAMSALQSYGQAEPIYDNKASTISSTYHDGQLKIYSHHQTQPPCPGELPQYHMTQLRSIAMTDSVQSFREGIGAFRNARDFTREQSDILIDQANTVAQT
ncbi:MAG: hypothetical protein Q9160_004473 [Pyrenula sp. 1 TL-2023]